MHNSNRITARKFSFNFPNGLNPKWVPNNIPLAHFFNGVSLIMPYLEPYLCRTNNEVRAHIHDQNLLEDIKGFNNQEFIHHACHRRINFLLRKNGYPEFEAVEKRNNEFYQRLSRRSLRTKLAYSAGFETMTQGFTKWLCGKRIALFANSCPYLTSFWLMHMVEEVEHKTVAFDAYMAYSGSYLHRALGVFHGTFGVVGYALMGMFTALKKDRLLWTFKGQLGIARVLGSVVWNVGPALLNALLPWHNPRNTKDAKWAREWLGAYPTIDPAEQPLIDTAHPDMPVPFA